MRHRARYRVNGQKVPLGTFDTYEEAEGAILAFAEGLIEKAPIAGETLDSWSVKWLNARETDGVHRSVKRDRHTFKRVTRAPIAQLPLAAITPADIRAWVAEQLKAKPARQTVVNALNLLRVCLEAACESGKLSVNPALGVRVPKLARTKEAWTWLRPAEIEKLLAGEDEKRDIYACAIFMGVRAGELFGLEWRDVDRINGVATIRHSWKGTPTKAGSVRNVTLMQPVLDALERQHKRTGKHRHVFAARDGQGRTMDQMPDLAASLKAVGITRHVRFHDLRHTCASALLQGTWAPKWIARPLRIEEVKEWLGHTAIATTQRYAHLCPESVAALVVRPTKSLPKSAPRLAPNAPKKSSGRTQLRSVKH